MKLKICGIQTPEALQACVDQNVDYVGLNFVPTSKRQITVPLEKGDTGGSKLVGVFQDQTTDFILQKVKDYQLDIIQLHGKETIEQVIELRLVKPVWKALVVDKNLNTKLLQSYCNNVELVLLDGKKPGSGNQISDQDQLSEVIYELTSMGVPVGLAGGLNPQNIPIILKKYPTLALLDLASGVETDGEFSPEKLAQIIKLLHV